MMADVSKIEIQGEDTVISLRISPEEYRLLRNRTTDLVLLPADHKTLNLSLTTGKLGNSNRIMLPKKVLERESIAEPDKKVASRIFRVNGEALLLIKLRKHEAIPRFSE
jgi:hypothetical protein